MAETLQYDSTVTFWGASYRHQGTTWLVKKLKMTTSCIDDYPGWIIARSAM